MSVGLSFRQPWYRSLVECGHGPDSMEILAEHFIELTSDQRLVLEQLGHRYALQPHCLSLSLGSPGRPERRYMHRLARIVELTRSPFISDHLAFVRSGRRALGHLAPLPFTQEAVDTVATNIRYVQKALGVRLLLENIAYVCPMPGSDMGEAEFIRRIVLDSGCALLLDVANLYANAHNHAYDPIAFLQGLPLTEVMGIHLAGGTWDRDLRIDSHDQVIDDPVWALYRHVLAFCRPQYVCIERDDNLPPYSEAMEEVDHAKSLVESALHPVAVQSVRPG